MIFSPILALKKYSINIKSMRLKFCKRSAEKFISRIDPEDFSASGSRVVFPVACDELEEILIKIPRCMRRGGSLF